ncbi:DUF922 domain-containing protein [Winogradskyella immobilis]|uniref:DUF922 domain-containing protein n=1 Tax=Winogradskyella immobilis TaxID=2816852 RepID=A0ABS8EQ90_9FLAO|nr:DUF922 domain-containing protein [Winogradskyella immobilis]MCC1485404.1 DUF922 domain-containing protein [Winogradskyella immobilis]MCG0017496.1 DUF922 domain-containing Zn-dependent protease [Winogradskyella immobilis]
MSLKLIIGIIAFLCIGNSPEDDTISWNENRKLTWADFKDRPNLNSGAVALTASGITFGFSIQKSGGKPVSFNTTVESLFYPDKSWYITERADSYILGHEQLHFDITELHARKFRQQINELKVSSNIRAKLNRLHTSINKASAAMQNKYDRESNHSIIKEAQLRWQKYIAAELEALEEFKSQ